MPCASGVSFPKTTPLRSPRNKQVHSIGVPLCAMHKSVQRSWHPVLGVQLDAGNSRCKVAGAHFGSVSEIPTLQIPGKAGI